MRWCVRLLWLLAPVHDVLISESEGLRHRSDTIHTPYCKSRVSISVWISSGNRDGRMHFRRVPKADLLCMGKGCNHMREFEFSKPRSGLFQFGYEPASQSQYELRGRMYWRRGVAGSAALCLTFLRTRGDYDMLRPKTMQICFIICIGST
jgi:hypothetical protein